MRIQADIAIAMSGGLDSTSVAALAMALKQDKGLHAVSWVFNEYPECDERDTIKKVAEHIGIDSVYIDGDELWPLSDPSSWPVIKESPVQNPFIRLTVEAARTGASAGCRAIFSGSRSDALMLGSRYWGIESLRQCGMNRFLGYLFSSDQAFQDSKKILRQLIGPLTPQLVKNVLRSVLRANKHSQLAALDREFLERMQLKENQAPAAITSPFAFNRLQRRNILEVAIGAQVGAFGRLLTNKHGIEYLDPFQDRRLFEYVLAVPAYVLGRPPYPKLLLRNAMTDVLPKQIVWSRDRVTLNSFYQKSMLQKARLTILELLTEPMVIKKGFISRSWIDQMRAWFQAGEKMSVMSESLWPILCVELWLRKYWNQ